MSDKTELLPCPTIDDGIPRCSGGACPAQKKCPVFNPRRDGKGAVCYPSLLAEVAALREQITAWEWCRREGWEMLYGYEEYRVWHMDDDPSVCYRGPTQTEAVLTAWKERG